ncbi:MAG: hypothetical protein RLZZ230_353 [Candidatus Parcubacteria bacterium]|jgi:hypothetical protein
MKIFKPVDDGNSIERNQVEEIVRALCVSYSQIRCSFFQNQPAINVALASGDITKVVQIMAECYKIPKGFLKQIGYSAKISSVAQIIFKVDVLACRTLGCTMYFQKTKVELCKGSDYLLFHMIAHELAHARLRLDSHALCNSEFATDVLAVLVIGNRKGHCSVIINQYEQYGYIRKELVTELFRCLEKYSGVIYLK